MHSSPPHDPWAARTRRLPLFDTGADGGLDPYAAARDVGPGWEPLLAHAFDVAWRHAGGPVVYVGHHLVDGGLEILGAAHAPAWADVVAATLGGTPDVWQAHTVAFLAFCERLRAESLRRCEMCGAPATPGLPPTAPPPELDAVHVATDAHALTSAVRIRCGACADVPSVNAGPEAAGMDPVYGWHGRGMDQDARAAAVAEIALVAFDGDRGRVREFLATCWAELDNERPEDVARLSVHHARRVRRYLTRVAETATPARPDAPEYTESRTSVAGASGAADGAASENAAR